MNNGFGIQNFFDWYASMSTYQGSQWLILGKGPSYSQLDKFDTSDYIKVALNHVIRDQRVDVAHMIDADVAIDCASYIDENAHVLVMPWVPHENNVVGKMNLDELTNTNPVLKKLKSEGRVKFYNFSTAKIRQGNSPIIPPCYFSSEAVVNLLALSGVKKIRTLGVDGGNQYSNKFSDLKEKTLLNNGHASFDFQFKSIIKKIMRENLDFAPMGIDVPVKIYVGSMPEQMICVKVLEYSIKKYATLPVEVVPLFKGNVQVPTPKDANNQPRTPFSFQRFIIPELNGFKGKAIYLDSDMQVFKDIKDLWARDMEGAQILSAFEMSQGKRRPQFSVMLIDCEKLPWRVAEIVKRMDAGELNYEQVLYEMKVADHISPTLEGEWNSLENYEEGKTKLLHYTDMGRQPWLFRVNPLTSIWVKALCESIKEGFISLNELKEHLVDSNLRPTLWVQVRFKRYDQRKLPRFIFLLDYFFLAPHQRAKAPNKMKYYMNRLVVRLLTTFV